MDVLYWLAVIFLHMVNALLRIAYWLLYGLIAGFGKLLIWLFGKATGKKPSRLPSGQSIIRYDDGKEFILLEAKGGKARHVPNTPELRQQLMQAKRARSIFRFLRRS